MDNINSNKIVEAIQKAELLTSREIRVYIAKRCKEDPLEKASRIFQKLKMHNTALRNSVLILVCPNDHKAAIIGDKGINSITEDNFWDTTLNELITFCSKGLITEGICKAVNKVGNLIKKAYPYQEGDINELDNEIIFEN